jgi:hypothetical protein
MFEDCLTVIEQRTCQKHFGANTFMVAIVTTSEMRMNSMMALPDRIGPGQAAKRFLFKYIPVGASYRQSAPATGHMLTEPWKRAGCPFEWRIEYRGEGGTGISSAPADPEKTFRILTLDAVHDALI